MNLIQIENLNISINSQKIIESFNFSQKEKEIIGLSGESGCGKTSFFNYINGNLNESEEIQVNGRYTKDEKLKIVYCFQNLRLLENLTVQKNITLPLDNSFNKNNFYQMVDEALEYFGLQNKINQKVLNLSGGEKQVVSIIRGILYAKSLGSKNKILLLLDECFNSLDENTSKKALFFTKNEISKNDFSAIVVSHQKSDLDYLCTKIIDCKSFRNSTFVEN